VRLPEYGSYAVTANVPGDRAMSTDVVHRPAGCVPAPRILAGNVTGRECLPAVGTPRAGGRTGCRSCRGHRAAVCVLTVVRAQPGQPCWPLTALAGSAALPPLPRVGHAARVATQSGLVRLAALGGLAVLMHSRVGPALPQLAVLATAGAVVAVGTRRAGG
jgi:hypothetical protein